MLLSSKVSIGPVKSSLVTLVRFDKRDRRQKRVRTHSNSLLADIWPPYPISVLRPHSKSGHFYGTVAAVASPGPRSSGSCPRIAPRASLRPALVLAESADTSQWEASAPTPRRFAVGLKDCSPECVRLQRPPAGILVKSEIEVERSAYRQQRR